MPDLWYPGAIRTPAPKSKWGSIVDLGEPKGCIHTTEAYGYSPSSSSYYGHQNWPHVTAEWMGTKWDFHQHIPLNYSARALRNLSGGSETNRDNVFQIEVCWKAAEVHNMTRKQLDGLRALMLWCREVKGIPMRCGVEFKPYPSSYGRNGVRLTGSQFDAYSGWLGHQHVPENDHGDPGAIDINYLLRVQPTATLKESTMFVGVTPDGRAYFSCGVGNGKVKVLNHDGLSVLARMEQRFPGKCPDVGQVSQAEFDYFVAAHNRDEHSA